MKQENEELLLKDLCARLPYGVYGNYLNSDGSLSDDELLRRVKIGYHDLICADGRNGMVLNGFLKPYLFPLSSMTEEQIEEAKTYFWKDVDYGKNSVDKGINCFYPCFNILEFYHKYHIDYRGLIPKGLAVDCTNLNIY